MSNFYEERCGRVAFERVVEMNDEINFLDKSGHLLSCGGVYVSRAPQLIPSNNKYDYLVLPNPQKQLLTLRNYEVLKGENLSEETLYKEEEMMDQATPSAMRKMLREHMN